jgi:hypothetical protein
MTYASINREISQPTMEHIFDTRTGSINRPMSNDNIDYDTIDVPILSE